MTPTFKRNKKAKKPTINDLPWELRGPPQNRFGGHNTQNLRAYPGGTYGSASESRKFTPEEIEAYATQHGYEVSKNLTSQSANTH